MPPAPGAEPPALPCTFRPTGTRVVLLGAGVVMLGVITAVALLVDRVTVWERMSFIAVALVYFAVLTVLSRPRVTADQDGVTVVNLLHTRRLEWAEIVRVNLRNGDPWVFLDLSDGTSLPALGIQPGIARRRAVADARRLRDLVETLGTGTDMA